MFASHKPEKPQRPVLPQMLYVLGASIVSARWLLEKGCSNGAILVLGSVMSGALTIGFCLWCTKRPAVLLFMMSTSMFLVSLVTIMQYQVLLQCNEELSCTSMARYEFVLVSDMQRGDTAWRGKAEAYLDGCYKGRVFIQASREYDLGTHIKGIGQYQSYKEDERGKRHWLEGIAGSVRMVRITTTSDSQGFLGTLHQARRAFLESINPHITAGRAIVAGCVCGYRGAFKEHALERPFAQCGISHLVAVSGSHLALLAGLVQVVLKKLSVRPLVRDAITLGIIGCFVMLCGFPLSAVRALLLVAASCGSEVLGRRKNPLASICTLAFCMILVQPAICESISFLLSLCSVLGLMVYGAYGRYGLRTITPRITSQRCPYTFKKRSNAFIQTGSDAIATTIVAQLATFPITTTIFGRLSLIAPVVNALLAIPFSILVVLGFLIFCTLPLSCITVTLLCGVDFVGALFVTLVRLFAHIPMSSILVDVPTYIVWLGFILIQIMLLIWWPDIRPKIVLLCVALVVAGCTCHVIRWRYFAPARVCVMDIGQGDAILVTDGASSMLIDTSPNDAVLDALQRQNVFHIDTVVLTHLDMDHVGGVDDLVGQISCNEVVVAKGVTKHEKAWLQSSIQKLTGKPSREVVYGEKLTVGRFHMKVISPLGEVTGNENTDSIEMVAFYHDDAGNSLTSLFTGDAEEDRTGEALQRGDVGDIDFLKVGHHGSARSITPEQVQKLKPEVSVASAGRNNTFGHPKPQCVTTLENGGSMFYCTKDFGDVTVEPGSKGPRVRTQHKNS